MSSLTVRRLVVWAVSLGVGVIVAALFVTLVLPWMGPHGGNPISIQTYGTQYFLWTALPLGLIVLVWLDRFMDTHILPE